MKLGDDVSIYDPVVIIKPELVSLGSHIILSEFVYINGGLGTYIGNHIHIAAHSSISGGGYFIMEDFAALAAGARVITGSASFDGQGLTNPTLPREFQTVYRSFVIMKKHSFLATNVVVHPGVIIGEGAVVGSGSVVTRDLEPWSIYRGAPAKKVRDRESSEMLKAEQALYESQRLTPADFSKIIDHVVTTMRK